MGTRPAFTLVELAIVLAIITIVAAIAVPRMSRAAESARASSVLGSVATVQRAVEMYAAEHADRGPEIDSDGSLTSTPSDIAKRLLRPTDDFGAVGAGGKYGPYLRAWPVNPYNGLRSIRVDGPPAGVNQAGWRYDSATRQVEADHIAGVVTSVAVGGAAEVANADLAAGGGP